MSNQNLPARQGQQPMSITIKTNDQLVEVNESQIKNYLCPNATRAEVFMFLQLCQAQNLNPFIGEVYLVKYKNKAEMIVGKETFLKRAESHPDYEGFEAGVIVYNSKKEITYRNGAFYVPDDEKLVGGWAEVKRKGIQPIRIEINLKEYIKYKADGGIQSMWKTMPGTMIRKVALVQAFREVFPSALGGCYIQEESSDQNERTIDVMDGANSSVPEAISNPKPITPMPERPMPEPDFTDTSQTNIDGITLKALNEKIYDCKTMQCLGDLWHEYKAFINEQDVEIQNNLKQNFNIRKAELEVTPQTTQSAPQPTPQITPHEQAKADGYMPQQQEMVVTEEQEQSSITGEKTTTILPPDKTQELPVDFQPTIGDLPVPPVSVAQYQWKDSQLNLQDELNKKSVTGLKGIISPYLSRAYGSSVTELKAFLNAWTGKEFLSRLSKAELVVIASVIIHHKGVTIEQAVAEAKAASAPKEAKTEPQPQGKAMDTEPTPKRTESHNPAADSAPPRPEPLPDPNPDGLSDEERFKLIMQNQSMKEIATMSFENIRDIAQGMVSIAFENPKDGTLDLNRMKAYIIGRTGKGIFSELTQVELLDLINELFIGNHKKPVENNQKLKPAPTPQNKPDHQLDLTNEESGIRVAKEIRLEMQRHFPLESEQDKFLDKWLFGNKLENLSTDQLKQLYKTIYSMMKNYDKEKTGESDAKDPF